MPTDPTCPECGAKIEQVGPRFTIDGKLSDMQVADAAGHYSENEDEYDDTTVAKFRCGNIVPLADLEIHS